MSRRSLPLVLLAVVALLLTPSAASAAWTVPPTPNPPPLSAGGLTFSSLNAVDCASANSCMAVGSEATCEDPCGPIHQFETATLTEHWDGTSWKIVPTPDPSTVPPLDPRSPSPSIGLSGVSCPWQNVCYAVGSTSDGSSSTPLIERWDGTSWSHLPTSPWAVGAALSAVSCSGLLACTAVGYDGGGGTHAERWDGRSWQVQSVPDGPNPHPGLDDVSCSLKRTCTAVGQLNGAVNSLAPLAERWFGRVNSWALQSAPEPDGAVGAELTGVSCPSGPVCFAVGQSASPMQPGNLGTPLIERRAGSTWSIMPTPGGVSELSDVSCPRVRECHAVGSGSDGAIGERFDGAAWHLETIPNAANGTEPGLASVSCPSRFFCMAVGTDNGGTFGGTAAAKWTP